jgi:ABC-type sugar transport system permease subunit
MNQQTSLVRMQRTSDLRTGLLFLLPTILVFAVFKYYVLGYNLYLSLTSWNFFSPDKRFIGLKNFKFILSGKVFWKVLGNTLYYTLGTTIISTILGFLFAVLLFARRTVTGSIFKTIFFIPNITTTSAMALLWIWIFDPIFGLSGQLFTLIGGESPRWLTDPNLAMLVVISLSVWRSAGYVMLIYIAGLTSIPRELYEAAKVDGASRLQQLRNITIPLLSPTTLFLMMTSVISAMQVFDVVAVMTKGGPFGSTTVLNLYIYQKAFGESKAGYSAALSIILFLLILSFTLMQKQLSKRWVKYD